MTVFLLVLKNWALLTLGSRALPDRKDIIKKYENA
jgi:hypothetical protein